MKPTVVYLLLGAVAWVVQANILAGPYQGVLLWYAYTLDVQANAGDATKTGLAPGCAQLHGKKCTFDQLLNFLEKDPTNGWRGPTTVGTNELPDAAKAAQSLLDTGYSANTDPTKAFPKIFSSANGVNFAKFYTAVIDTFQAGRRAASDTGIDVQKAQGLLAMDGVTAARVADAAHYNIENLNKVIANKGLTWSVDTKFVPTSIPLFGNIQIPDTDATINNHQSDLKKFQNAVNTYTSQGYANGVQNQDNKLAKSHYGAAQSCQALSTRIRTGTC